MLLVGLPQSQEGDDPVGFLQKMLPTWRPALKKKGPIEIDQAHIIYGSVKSCTLIFRMLRYQDRQAILQGAREVMKTKPIRDQDHLLRFFAPTAAGSPAVDDRPSEVFKRNCKHWELRTSSFILPFFASVLMEINIHSIQLKKPRNSWWRYVVATHQVPVVNWPFMDHRRLQSLWMSKESMNGLGVSASVRVSICFRGFES